MTARKVLPDALAEPKPTVREAMRFDPFASAKLVAGANGLDRPIEWVRAMETPEVQPRAGDLIFTTGFPIKDDPEAQIRLIARIADSEGAGLVVRPHPYLRKLPPEMLSEADRLNVPLFTVAADVQMVDLMAPAARADHQRRALAPEALDRDPPALHRARARRQGRQGDLPHAGRAARERGRDRGRELPPPRPRRRRGDPHRKETIQRQGTPQRVLFDPQIQRMLREVEARRGPVKVPAFPHVGMSRERLIAPILAANQVLGYISVLDHPPHNEELAFMAIEQAALVLALAVAKERELSEVEGRVRGEFLEDLLHGTYGDEAAAQRRARHLGYPLHGNHIVMLVDIDDFRGFIGSRQISEDAIQALKREFLRRVTGVVRASYPRALVQGRSDSVVALLPLGTEPGDYQARGHALGLQIRQTIADWKPGFTVSVGFSGPTEAPAGVAAAQREVHLGDGVARALQALGPGRRRARAGAHRPAGRGHRRAPGRLQPPAPRPAHRARHAPAREASWPPCAPTSRRASSRRRPSACASTRTRCATGSIASARSAASTSRTPRRASTWRSRCASRPSWV